MGNSTEAKEGDTGQPKDPATLAAELGEKLKLNRILLFVCAGLFLLTLILLGAGFALIHHRVETLANTPQEAVDQQLQGIHAELATMQSTLDKEKETLDEFDARLNTMKEESSSTRLIALKKVYLDREKDYQHMVDVLRGSTESLANMMPGQRDWVDFYNTEMEGLKKRSRAREVAVDAALPDNMIRQDNNASEHTAAKPLDKQAEKQTAKPTEKPVENTVNTASDHHE